jgi:ribosomal protein L37E
MVFICPKCGKPLSNRRRNKCSYCSAEIPEKLRLTSKQQKRLQQMRSSEEKEHREFMEKEWPGSTPGMPPTLGGF